MLSTDLLLTNRQHLFSIKCTSVPYLASLSVNLDYQLYCKCLWNSEWRSQVASTMGGWIKEIIWNISAEVIKCKWPRNVLCVWFWTIKTAWKGCHLSALVSVAGLAVFAGFKVCQSIIGAVILKAKKPNDKSILCYKRGREQNTILAQRGVNFKSRSVAVLVAVKIFQCVSPLNINQSMQQLFGSL